MNLKHLKTLVAVADQPSFMAAGVQLGLSHSAVSLHIKALEENLQVSLVDRRRRPPVLTARGWVLVDAARRMLDIADEVAGLGAQDSLVGALAVGVVPTALTSLLPPALAGLQARHPKLRVKVRAGLSEDLAQALRARELDVAVTSEAEDQPLGLRSRLICREPLYVIAPNWAKGESDADLLRSNPFILFDRRSWIGRQIQRRLDARRISVNESMEISSLEAIEAMVRQGLGVAIAPQRAGAPRLSETLRMVPFCHPQMVRNLQFLERENHARGLLSDALYHELLNVARTEKGG